MAFLHRNINHLYIVLAVIVTLSVSPLLAQERDVQTFDDWGASCVERENNRPCAMFQTINNSETNDLIMRVSISPLGLAEADIAAFQIIITPGVFVNGGLVIEVDSEAVTPQNIGFTRCNDALCFIEGTATGAELEAFAKGENARFAVRQSNGRPRVLPISLKGFSAALKKVKSENTRWVKNNS